MSSSENYTVDFRISERFIYEVEIEAPNVEAIRDNWDEYSRYLAGDASVWFADEKMANAGDRDQSQHLDAPNFEAELLPKLWKSDVQPVEGTAVLINYEDLGVTLVNVEK